MTTPLPPKFKEPAAETDGKNRSQRRAEGAVKLPPAVQAFVDVFNQGLQAQQSGNLPLAEEFYLKALKMNPNDSMLLNNYGVCVYEQGRAEEAVEIHRKAVKLDPTKPMAYNNLGVELNALERHVEAIEAFKKAVEIAPFNPKAINNYGDSLVKLGRFDEGLAMLQKSLEQEPEYVDAHSNLGMALWGLARFDEAIMSFRRALSYKIDHAQVRKNLGLVLLLAGDWSHAWTEYEWRWIADKLPSRSAKPRWVGEDLKGKTIFVWSEQGVGDEILHTSMAEDLLARGCKVVWETDTRLVPLLQRSYPDIKVVSRHYPPLPETATDDIVLQSPSASLGTFLRHDISQFPKERGGYLKADTRRAKILKSYLDIAPGEKLVGVSWVSKNRTIGANKTINLEDWADILRTPGVKFVDLQYGKTQEERDALSQKLGLTVQHIDGLDLTRDLDGLASLIAACDLVVTVSNTTAHLAGALGVPTWVLLPAKLGKFWYWGHDTETSLWYSSATIIRQSVKDTHDWGPTLRATAERLRTHFAGS